MGSAIGGTPDPALEAGGADAQSAPEPKAGTKSDRRSRKPQRKNAASRACTLAASASIVPPGASFTLAWAAQGEISSARIAQGNVVIVPSPSLPSGSLPV